MLYAYTCSHARIAGLVSRQTAEDSSVVSSTFHRLGDDVSRDLASGMETPSQASSVSFRTRSLYTTMTCRQTTKVVGSSIDLCTYKKGWLLPVCTTYPITKRQSTPIQANFSSLSPKKTTKQDKTKTKMPSSIMLKLLLSSLIAAVSARQICGTCYNAGNKPIFAGSATGGEWKCDAYCDQNMVNAANEVCCVRINVFFFSP